MLKTLLDLQRQLKAETDAPPVLPKAPAGHFWHVTNELFAGGNAYSGSYFYISEDEFDVELRRELPPTRLLKHKRSERVGSQRVSPRQARFKGFSVAELTVWAAEEILKERGEATKLYTAIKQVVGDYR